MAGAFAVLLAGPATAAPPDPTVDQYVPSLPEPSGEAPLRPGTPPDGTTAAPLPAPVDAALGDDADGRVLRRLAATAPAGEDSRRAVRRGERRAPRRRASVERRDTAPAPPALAPALARSVAGDDSVPVSAVLAALAAITLAAVLLARRRRA